MLCLLEFLLLMCPTHTRGCAQACHWFWDTALGRARRRADLVLLARERFKSPCCVLFDMLTRDRRLFVRTSEAPLADILDSNSATIEIDDSYKGAEAICDVLLVTPWQESEAR